MSVMNRETLKKYLQNESFMQVLRQKIEIEKITKEIAGAYRIMEEVRASNETLTEIRKNKKNTIKSAKTWE